MAYAGKDGYLGKFTLLSDAFTSYFGLGGKFLKVKVDESGLETGSAPSGSGDMLASDYDPNNIVADVFDMDNMVDGTYVKTKNNLTDALLADIYAQYSDAETATTIAAINHGATEKTALLSADEITGQDSANSFSLIRTTWTNVKVFLKTYFDGLYATLAHDQNASTIIISSGIGTPAYDDVQDFLNLTQSSGRFTGGVITEHAGPNGTIDISEMQGMIRAGTTLAHPMVYFKKAAVSGMALFGEGVNFIIATYNAGAVDYSAAALRPANSTLGAFVVGRCYKNGNPVEVETTGQNVYDQYGRIQDRMLTKYGQMDRASGGNITAHATALRLTCDAGVWYVGNTQLTTGVQNQFHVWYKSGSATWVESALLTLFSEVFDGGGGHKVYETYQNGTTLTALGANKYGIYWIFICPAGDLYAVLGTSNYANIGLAQAASVPAALPPYCVNWAKFIGKVIIQNTGAAFYSVESAFAQSFTLSQNIDIQTIMLTAYPVGSIYTSVVATNPNTFFGGTWAAFGTGQVLVGIDTGDTDFDVVKEAGGFKTRTPDVHAGTAVEDHTFTQPNAHAVHLHPYGTIAVQAHSTTSNARGASSGTIVTTATHTVSGSTGNNASTQSHAGGGVNAHAVTQPSTHAAMSIVQPYIVVYFWERTA